MTYVLIIWFATSSGFFAVTTQEFDSPTQCEVAAKVVVQPSPGNIRAQCVRK